MAVVTPFAKSVEPKMIEDNGTFRPLENGDRLTRAEFERRYDAMPELKKAELIEGEVYMPSPVRYEQHGLGKKLNAYRRNGVREYIVWRVLDRQVDWLVNREGQFEPLRPTADGILRSTIFPGLWLDPNALVNGEKTTVKAILEQGLNTPEHAEFVARLEQARIA